MLGKTIIVLRNAPRADYIAASYPGSDVLTVDKESNVYLELAAGRSGIAFFSSVVSAEAFLKTSQGAGFAQVGATIRLNANDGGVGIAPRKTDSALRDRATAALAAVKAGGAYDALQAEFLRL